MSHEFHPNGVEKILRNRERPNDYSLDCLTSWWTIEKNALNEHVRVNREVLASTVNQVFDAEYHLPSGLAPGLYPLSDRAFAVQTLFFATQNFAFSLPDHRGEQYCVSDPYNPSRPFEGSFALQANIFRRFGERDDITTEMLYPIFSSEKNVSEFYSGENTVPYLDLRLETGRDFIEGLDHYYDGSVRNLYDSFYKDGLMQAYGDEGLVPSLIRDFPIAFGDDRESVAGNPFPFYTRAQSVPLMLHGRQVASGQQFLPKCIDISRSGPTPDAAISKALSAMGILEYSEEVSQRIKHWVPLERGSDEEIEIRAASVAASYELQTIINEARAFTGQSMILSPHIEYMLWNAGHLNTFTYPHLTRTSAY